MMAAVNYIVFFIKELGKDIVRPLGKTVFWI